LYHSASGLSGRISISSVPRSSLSPPLCSCLLLHELLENRGAAVTVDPICNACTQSLPYDFSLDLIPRSLVCLCRSAFLCQ
jgi:hypothetical protein